MQACLTQFQEHDWISQKKVPKMVKINQFWPFFALKLILNLEKSFEILHAHKINPI